MMLFRVFWLTFLCALAPSLGFAQDIPFLTGGGQSLSATTIQFILVISVLSVAPGILIMVTCFPFLITVLSILRQAIGLQQSPPNMLLVSLALFMTLYIMEPVFTDSWQNGIQPYLNEEADVSEAFTQGVEPFRIFMANRVDSETLQTLYSVRFKEEYLGDDVSRVPLSVLVPSFLLSELSRAFQVGFLIFMPFLVIDLVTAAVLMSMGMMMVPPAIVSLPFKLGFFVFADGWMLLSASLVRSYQ